MKGISRRRSFLCVVVVVILNFESTTSSTDALSFERCTHNEQLRCGENLDASDEKVGGVTVEHILRSTVGPH